MACHVDIETFSECDLKKAGTYTYAEHPSTEVSVVCFSFGDGPVHVWITRDECPEEALPTEFEIDEGSKLYVQRTCPEEITEWAANGGEFRAWNALFERTLLRGPAGRAIGWPPTRLEQWVCVMAKAQAHSLPAALEHAANACHTHPKDKTGHFVMMQLAKPRKPSKKDPDERWYIEKYPEKYQQLYEYCVDDVRAEADLDRYIPDLSANELRAYHLDQRINDRGIQVDLESVANVQFLIDEYKALLVEKCVQWTGLRPTQLEKLAEWVRAQGFEIENFQAPTIKEAVLREDCPPQVKRVLQLYSVYNMKAVSKYPAMERAAELDGRLRGMFVYHAASTGRWSSRIVQLQNLFRPVIKDPEVAIEAFRIRCLEWVKDLWPKNPMHVFASCVRGMLVPRYGYELLCLDFKQIEARVIAWLAGQTDVLEIFESGADIYRHAAAGIYRKKIEDVTDDERFVGKIAILALGYQGGKKAFAKMAKNYGADIDEDFAESIKLDWRAANPNIVDLWYTMERAATAAIENPGAVYEVNGKIMFKVVGDWLYMRLPSGRRLAYYKPGLDWEGKPTFLGTNTYSRRWERCKTYGGMLVENAVQAIARDLLLFALFNMEKAGYPIVGTVHDEGIFEVTEGFATLEVAGEIFCRKPKWGEEIPVEADGFIAQRYKK